MGDTGGSRSARLVSSPDEVTPEWMTEALSLSGAAPPGAAVVSVRHEVIGEGKIGSNVRFELEWSGPGSDGALSSVVGKFPAVDPNSRATGINLGLYVREVRFYAELAPEVRSRVPACHLAACDEETGEFVLLLEDLAPAVPGDQLAGCSVDEAAAAVDELALLHASFYRRGLPEWVPLDLAGGAEAIAEVFSLLAPGFAEKYEGVLGEEVLEVVATFARTMREWGAAASAGPHTLCHGDYRLDNLLFGAGRVAAVDWQVVGVGSPASDLAYFLGAGLLPEVRRAHERELVERYHGRLVELGIDDWPLAELAELYRLNAPGGLVMAVFPAMMVDASERSDAMFAAMAERHALHALDLGSLAGFD